ncbi:MAG: aminopeptidase [Solirubrobacterales bacterium]
MKDIRLSKLAKLLVNYSARVKPSDFVLVSGDCVVEPWIQEVVKEAIIAGAHVETIISSQQVNDVKLKYCSNEQLVQDNLIMKYALENASVWLSAWGTRNTKSNSGVSEERLTLSAKGSEGWHRVYSDKVGDGSLRWCGTQFPTYANAQDASMSLEEYEDFVYEAGLLHLEDPVAEWEKISKDQERWIKYLDTKKELHIISTGTDIKINIEDRKWINCDGRENFPDGEIFTSPVEDGIDGYITFSFPGVYMGKEIEDIRLTVEKGRVIEANAKHGEKLLKALLESDEGASRFGEVAIGTNYNIKKFTKNMLFDEKIGGTIHMALGDSMPEAGGKNKSNIHWDMLCDMRSEGRMFADGELFYENGNFIMDVLKKYDI